MIKFLAVSNMLVAGMIQAAGPAFATSSRHCRQVNNIAPQTESKSGLESMACVDGKAYFLTYSYKSGHISLRSPDRVNVLAKVPKRFDPTLVGSERLIAFLPNELQPYLKKKVVLYTTAIRTSGGTGGGQCGSGSEIYLHALDVKKTQPKVLSSVLVSSCEQSIELYDADIGSGKIGSMKTVNGYLRARFLYYRGDDERGHARLSADFKRLEFE